MGGVIQGLALGNWVACCPDPPSPYFKVLFLTLVEFFICIKRRETDLFPQVELIRRDYVANGGWETFLSYEDPEQGTFSCVLVCFPKQNYMCVNHLTHFCLYFELGLFLP